MFATFQVLGASPAFADGDVSVAALSVGVGSSGTQQISIPAGSGLIGQSTPLVVMPDAALSGTGFSATVDAGDTGGSCAADSGDSGHTCQAPAAGWTAGSLDLDFDAGGPTTPVPACGASCGFTTSVFENDTSGTAVADGTVTTTAEASLSLVLTGFSGGGLTISVSNSGPTETADLSVSLSGFGNYAVSSADARCGAAGSAFVCDAGDTTGTQKTSANWSVTLSGGSGPISLGASAYASVYPGGVVDTLSGSASTKLNWTPVTAPSPPPGGGSTVAAGKPTQTGPAKVTVQASATGKAKAAPGGDKAPPVLVTAKAEKIASAVATATVSAGQSASAAAPGAQIGPLAGSSAPAVAGGTGTGGTTGSGSGSLLVVLICVAALALLALAAWRLWLAAARRRDDSDDGDEDFEGGGNRPPLPPSAAAITPRPAPVRPYGSRPAVQSVVESAPRPAMRPGAGPAVGRPVPARGEQQTEVLSAFFSRSVVTPGSEQDSEAGQGAGSGPDSGAGAGAGAGAGSGSGSGDRESARSVLSALSESNEGLDAAGRGDRNGESGNVRSGRGREESAGESTLELNRPAIAAGGRGIAERTADPAAPPDVPERGMDDTGPIDLSQFFTRTRASDPRTPSADQEPDDDDPDAPPRRW